MGVTEKSNQAAAKKDGVVPSRDRAGTTRAASGAAVVSLGLSMAAQFATPPILLSRWHDTGFALFVAVQGFASYVSVADAGVQLYLIQRLATLRASGETLAADALTRGGLRAFAMLALAGAALVSLAFVLTGHRVWYELAHTCGMGARDVLAGALSQIVAGGFSLGLGGWSTAVDYGHGRYVRVQFFGTLRMIVTTIGVVALAEARVGPAAVMMIVGLVQIAFELTRFTLTFRGERWGVTEAAPARRILREARGSVVLMFSTTTQNGLQPYVTAALSSTVVSVAVPGRTLANGARTLSTAIGSVAFVSVAARFAELSDARARYALWVRNAPLMSLVQLGGVAALLGLAPFVVPHWLPRQSAAILGLLPLYGLEQGAFAASVPVVILAQAVGRFGALGGITLASAVVSIGATLLLVPRYGAVGFAGANAAAAALVFVPALIVWEWNYWRGLGVKAGSTLIWRGLMVVAAAAIALAEWRSPPLGFGLCLILTVGVGLGAMRLRRRG